MFELGSELRRERNKISERKKRFNKFVTYAWFCMLSGLFLFIALLFLTTEPYGLIKGISPFVSFIPYLLGILFGIIVGRVGRPYKLSVEESLFLDVCSALDDLAAYIEDKRGADRKRAERELDGIVKEMDTWNVGSLRLCEKIIGSRFEPFRKAFYRKIIGAVRQGESDDLFTAYGILKTFAKFLVKSEPKIEELDSMTESMNEHISVTIPSRIPTKRKIFRSLKEATPLRHAFVIALSILGGYGIGHIGYYNVGVQKEHAYLVAVTVPLTLIGLYLNYLKGK